MKFVDAEWRKYSLVLKSQLISKFLDLNGLTSEFYQYRINRINLDVSLGLVRDFRSFCKVKKFSYSKSVSWMVLYYHFLQDAVEIAKTKWLDDD